METMIVGTFPSHTKVESLVRDLKEEHLIPASDISYLHRDMEGVIDDTPADLAADDSVESAASGAVIGGSLGATVGLAAVAGIIPGIGPILAAGPFAAMLGIGSGALATTAAGALTGAVAGGLAGGLASLGASEAEARDYEERVRAGDALVIVRAQEATGIQDSFLAHGATSVHVYPSRSV